MEYFIAGGTVATLILGMVPYWIFSRRRKIRWTILRPRSMMEVSPEVSKDIRITYREHSISSSLTKLMFVVHYTGSVPLDKSSIVEPLTWTTSAKVVDAWLIASDSGFKPECSAKDNKVVISWDLLNPGWKAVIGVLCESSSASDYGSIRARIKDVSRVVTKKRVRNRLSVTRFVLVSFFSTIAGLLVGANVYGELPIGPDVTWGWLTGIGTTVAIVLGYAFFLGPLFSSYSKLIARAHSIENKRNTAQPEELPSRGGAR